MIRGGAAQAQLIGECPEIRRLRDRIARVAPVNVPVLIQGPTGSGKEVVARSLHDASGRTGALVAFNVCAVSESMFEDALFGHVRGAFTGAIADVRGYVGDANGGTLFLDEVGSLSLPMQAKLLRTLDTGVYRPVGAPADRVSDFRVVAATNEDLRALVRAGRFRQDLLYRFNGDLLELPPLSDRGGDIALLAEHFLTSSAHSAGMRLSPSALRRLLRHSWPGNVRELKHVMQRAAATSESREIGLATINAAIGDAEMSPGISGPSSDGSRDAERKELAELLQRYKGDTFQVAVTLGINRTTVYRRMWRLGLAVRRALPRDAETPAQSTSVA